MTTKLTYATALLGCLTALPSQAHISNVNIGTLGSTPLTRTFSGTGNTWSFGAANALGNSHVAIKFSTFSLLQPSDVRIDLNEISRTTANPVNPAFSFYAGSLPNLAHDDAFVDPLHPLDDITALPVMSEKDHAPGDPNIAHFIAQYNQYGQIVTDTVGNALVVENPVWNTPNPNGANLGGLTPAQWYAANYTPHNGYRDTLNFSGAGGTSIDPNTQTLITGAYNGQFDAFGSWSMANDSNIWSSLAYISSASHTACSGPNCAMTTVNGYSNPGHFSSNNTNTESMLLHLAAGTYTIIAGTEQGSGSGYTQLSVTAVPLPGGIWLMGSVLMGYLGMRPRKA